MNVGAPQYAAGGRPGAVSTFFVYKAGLFAAGFWGWLLVLAVRDGAPSGWSLVAAAGAVTTTLLGVVLGVRIALARHAVDRQEQLMRTMVEISWYALAQGSSTVPSQPGPRLTNVDDDADVIPLAQESRPRPRR